ncbi:hypothetical protein [Methylocella sp.]|uniref:hypothetical protein n=1 Tax=Methylocella sp. TaxID=1978226 RepID=UPI003784C1AC
MFGSGADFFAAATHDLMSPDNRSFLALVLGSGFVLLVGFWGARRLMRALPDSYGEASPPTDAERDGVTAASREAVAAMLQAENLDATQFERRLGQAIDMLAKLRTRLADACPAALALVDAGDFAAARAALRNGRDPRGVGPDQAKREARLYTAAAVIDQIKLDYRGAAENYDVAATLVSQVGEEEARGQEWRLRIEQARALVGDATVKGNADSIGPALAVYDKALELAPRRAAPHAWAQTQMHRGDALLAGGLAAAEPRLVEDAVQSYQAALEEWTRRATPFEWARAQHNLGEALRRLADFDSGVERLQPAADAYRAALSAWTREAAPDLWAMTQGGLGDALAVIGAHTGDGDTLREAIAAYQAALGELRREIAPQEWAQIQNSLGVALEALAEHEHREGDYGAKPLKLAVEAFQHALEGRSAETDPAQYAATSVGLGDSLLSLGEHEAETNPEYGADLLARAAEAYRGALKVRDAITPQEVARIEINLAYALGLSWTGARDDALLDEALAHVEDAIALLRESGDAEHLAAAEAARRNILDARRGEAA